MQYNGFYFALFRGTRKRVLSEHYGAKPLRRHHEAARRLYKKLVTEADDIAPATPWPITSCLP